MRVLTFSLGFGPKLLAFTRGRHRVLHQRHPARRLREDGRRESGRRPHRRGRRVPVEDEMAALPGPGHGPGDEPGARARGDGASCSTRARRCRPSSSSRSSSAVVQDPSVAEARRLLAGDHIVTVDGKTGRDLGTVLDGDRRQGRSGKSRSASIRDGQTGRHLRSCRRRSRASTRSATVGVQPIMHPQIVAVSQGRRPKRPGCRPGDVVLAADGEHDVSREHLIDIDQGARRPADRARGQARRSASSRSRVTPRQIGDKVMIGAQFSAFEERRRSSRARSKRSR